MHYMYICCHSGSMVDDCIFIRIACYQSKSIIYIPKRQSCKCTQNITISFIMHITPEMNVPHYYSFNSKFIKLAFTPVRI